MKILKLTLKKKWFDLIASGEKKDATTGEPNGVLQRLRLSLSGSEKS
jgi:hypothetical protein